MKQLNNKVELVQYLFQKESGFPSLRDEAVDISTTLINCARFIERNWGFAQSWHSINFSSKHPHTMMTKQKWSIASQKIY